MLEIFKLNFFSNSIPAVETRAAGTGYNNISTVNDFADLFVNYVTPTAFTISQSAGSGFNLSFMVATNQSYRVLAAGQANAPEGDWTQVASGVAVTNPVVVADTNSFGARFYRVVSP